MHYPGDLLEHLRAFRALARRAKTRPRGAFVDAAIELGLDVSVLRRRMQTLTAWVGHPLLEGRGARLRVAADGQALLGRGERLLAEAEALARPPAPSLAVGCTGSVATELLPRALGRVRAQHAGLVVRIRRAGHEASRQLLGRGELDMAVVRSDDAPPGLEARRLVRDRLWLAAPRRHPLMTAAHVDLGALARYPLVSFPESSFTRRRVLDRLGPLGATVAIEVDGKSAALRYVEAGFGITLLSLVPGARVESRLALRDVSHLFAPSAFWLAWNEDRALRPWERALASELAALARQAR
jgi:DNA-binding transcriptional LysR family regulator